MGIISREVSITHILTKFAGTNQGGTYEVGEASSSLSRFQMPMGMQTERPTLLSQDMSKAGCTGLLVHMKPDTQTGRPRACHFLDTFGRLAYGIPVRQRLVRLTHHLLAGMAKTMGRKRLMRWDCRAGKDRRHLLQGN